MVPIERETRGIANDLERFSQASGRSSKSETYSIAPLANPKPEDL